MTPPPTSVDVEVDEQTLAHLQENNAELGTMGGETKAKWEQWALLAFIIIPFLAVLAAVPLAWMFGAIGWSDVIIALVFYTVAGFGITVGFHRYFTHGAFKAKRPLRIALAIAGSKAIEGPVNRRVADHPKHQAHTNRCQRHYHARG